MITGTSKAALGAARFSLLAGVSTAALAMAAAFAAAPAAAQTTDPVQVAAPCVQNATEFACGTGSTTAGSGGLAVLIHQAGDLSC